MDRRRETSSPFVTRILLVAAVLLVALAVRRPGGRVPHRAAWLLARRHPRPDVVVGLAAAKRSLQARAEETADLPA
jgi:hypothetical protein